MDAGKLVVFIRIVARPPPLVDLQRRLRSVFGMLGKLKGDFAISLLLEIDVRLSTVDFVVAAFIELLISQDRVPLDDGKKCATHGIFQLLEVEPSSSHVRQEVLVLLQVSLCQVESPLNIGGLVLALCHGH